MEHLVLHLEDTLLVVEVVEIKDSALIYLDLLQEVVEMVVVVLVAVVLRVVTLVVAVVVDLMVLVQTHLKSVELADLVLS
tara:strand:- start:105 stop:344 length:240 start_codon:yes stop_codon:yes gene_type:complete